MSQYENETISIKGTQSVAATSHAIEQALLDKGFSIFLRLDQQAEAEKVAMTMPATVVILFGNPEVGTQLMIDYPSIALELPLKLVVQENDDQTSMVRLNAPDYLAKRHDISQPIFAPLEALLRSVVH